ncbi:hypothetical protein [Pseudomonas putida]
MSEYVFSPRDSFLARCWWQGAGVQIGPDAWDQVKARLAALWLQVGSRGSRGSRGSWDRYLQAEAQGVLEKHLDPTYYVTPDLQCYELFWFGAYTQGSYAADKPLFYEVRAADRVWTVSGWALDYSITFLFNSSGYVGVWEATEQAGVHRKPEGARLWSIEGLAREGLKSGDRQFNLRLLTPGAQSMRSYKTDELSAFHIKSGDSGFVAMEFLSIPHHFDEA